jgi:hypothetical protein
MDKKNRKTESPTSGNREESMSESGDDQFERKGAAARKSRQSPASSGTVGLGGEDRDSESAQERGEEN